MGALQITQYLRSGLNQVEVKTTNFTPDPKLFFIALLLVDTKTPEALEVPQTLSPEH